MNGIEAEREDSAVRIVREMNDHGAMAVEIEGTNETRHVVEYEERSVKSILSRLPAGSSVPLELEQLPTRANAWRAVGIGGR